MTMNPVRLRLTKISSSYRCGDQNLPVLNNISLAVRAGEFVSLLGPSGSGKSTILKIAAGLLKPDRGRVMVNRREVTRAVKVGYMPQQDLLFPWKTLLENCALPLIAEGANRSQACEQVRELLEIFGLTGFEHYYPSQLSGGMKQRAALLRTVLIDSNLMLLDEPFAALDAITRQYLQEWLLDILNRFKRSVLFVTHSVDEAIYLSDRICMISDRPGRIVMETQISLPRPRSRAVVTSSLFLKYKQELMDTLATSGCAGQGEA
ncbi:MAG TPA: ABC transporter ATP-binding protein [Firmicutes bacterium]|nr:ABC transporter ATP-binding protein [Bacillota bacterium]